MGYLPERKHPRFDFSTLPFVLSVRWEEPFLEERPLRIEGRNVSGGGIKFSSNRRLSLFAPVQLTLFGREQGQPLVTLAGKVVRVEEVETGLGERTYGIAVQFSSGTDALLSLLPSANPPAASAPENSNPAT